MKKLKLAAVLVALLLAAAACAPTHLTIEAALAGNAGDNVQLDVVFVNRAAVHVPRDPARDLLRFEGCDRSGACIQIENLSTSDQIQRTLDGEWLAEGEWVEVRGGELISDEGRLRIRAGIVSRVPAPDDWPE